MKLKMQQEETDVYSVRGPQSLIQRLKQLGERVEKVSVPRKQKPSIAETLCDYMEQVADDVEAWLGKVEVVNKSDGILFTESTTETFANGESK